MRILSSKNKLRGLVFVVYNDGFVYSKKGYLECGYLSELDLIEISKNNVSGLTLDKLIKERLKIPSTIKEKVDKFLDKFNHRKNAKRSRKLKRDINKKMLKKAEDYLTDLEYEVLERIYIRKQRMKNIAFQLGISYGYVAVIKSKAVKKICKQK